MEERIAELEKQLKERDEKIAIIIPDEVKVYCRALRFVIWEELKIKGH